MRAAGKAPMTVANGEGSPMRPFLTLLVLAATFLVAIAAGIGRAEPRILPVAMDPGHETSASGWWCWNGDALPAPHDAEYQAGKADHPCTDEELANACRYFREAGLTTALPYCEP